MKRRHSTATTRRADIIDSRTKKADKVMGSLRTEKMAPNLNMGEVLGQGEFNQTVTQTNDDSLESVTTVARKGTFRKIARSRRNQQKGTW